MKIAICDDNLDFIKQIEEIVFFTYEEMQRKAGISCYQNGKLLLEEIQKNDVDVILLDIDLSCGWSGTAYLENHERAAKGTFSRAFFKDT